MSEYTSNLNLEKPSGNDNFQRQVINENMEKVDKKFGIGTDEGHTHDGTAGQGKKISYNSLTDKPAAVAYTAGGTGTAITLAMPSFTAYNDKSLLTFIATAQNSGAVTTINVNGLGTKPLYKPNTTTVPNLSAGKAYTVWYDAAGGCFFIKASAEGTAVAADVLAGRTFSNDNDTGMAGTMANNGPATAETISFTTEGAEYTIAAGFHSGLRKIKATITNIAAAVIKAGVTVGGIVGTFTADATAAASQILAGYSAYVNGAKVTGVMPLQGNDEYYGWKRAITGTQTIGGRIHLGIPMGAYLTQAPGGEVPAGYMGIFCDDVDFTPANFRADKNLFGMQGSIPIYPDSLNQPDQVAYWAPNTSGNQYARAWMHVPYGLANTSGAWFYSDQPDLLPQNIVDGKSIFGVAGTYGKAEIGDASKFLIMDPHIMSDRSVEGREYATFSTPTIYIEKAGEYRLYGETACYNRYGTMTDSRFTMGIYKNNVLLQSTVSAAGIPATNTRGIWTYDLTLQAGDRIHIYCYYSVVVGGNMSLARYGLKSNQVLNAHF